MVTAARRIAFDILRRVEAETAYSGELLHAVLSDTRAPIKREDAALATELTLGVLRWQRLLDFVIERQTGKPLAGLDLEVLLALRLGLYQLRFLTRVPPSAAVNESVELVKAARKRSAASLVNAVLRKAPREEAEKLVPPGLVPETRLGLLHSHPDWMVARWLARFGETRTVALLEANNRAPALTCVIHQPDRRQEILQELTQAGMRVEPGQWLASAITMRGGNPAATRAFRRGWISMQDEASQMVALLLDARPGQAALDLCAAPGGKTAALARATGDQALVIAADLHAHRLRAMEQTMKRLGIDWVPRVALDGTASLPFSRMFERILVDAPCSGTGTLARNPEIRWRLCSGDLADLHQRQVALLRNALRLLAPAGRLLFSTCSLEPEENEQVLDEALRDVPGFRRMTSMDALQLHVREGADTARLFSADGAFRTFPPEHGTDGFFAVVVQRHE
ncbi:MAG: 16S rRNA (cytosine(967)-C(5))-methyltransferase RsmB [Acidobacteria bacterium]|nr:16S rRNA (cytosine(967)-C(5))-methyltransferase RsmB [Acidobacteriota bacterium]MBI3663710.1 16S rRNA (cytosine(967)-C(5))-methyltransferase RsmB [Acidobacteriota bacterium]